MFGFYTVWCQHQTDGGYFLSRAHTHTCTSHSLGFAFLTSLTLVLKRISCVFNVEAVQKLCFLMALLCLSRRTFYPTSQIRKWMKQSFLEDMFFVILWSYDFETQMTMNIIILKIWQFDRLSVSCLSIQQPTVIILLLVRSHAPPTAFMC